MKNIRAFFAAFCILTASASSAFSQNATILPLAKTCFSDASGNPLVAGTVNMDIPATTTAKNTWIDATQSTLNTNPIVLDSAGCALIYGSGTYRQIVRDALGNLIWDQLTDQPATSILVQNGGYIWGGTSTGSSNSYAINLSPAIGAYAAGQEFRFLPNFTNTGAATLNVSSLGAKNIYREVNGSGPVALIGGEIQSGQPIIVIYDGTEFVIASTSNNPVLGAPSTIASATTTDLGSVFTQLITVSGTTTIASFGASAPAGTIKYVTFSGALQITYNATSMILPGAANWETQANERYAFMALGSGNWQMLAAFIQGGSAIDTVGTGIATNTGSFVTSGVTVTLTPHSAASTYRLVATGGMDADSGANVLLTFFRGSSTNLAPNSLSFFIQGLGSVIGQSGVTPFAFTYVDSPATTSAVTYTIYISSSGSGAAFLNRRSADSNIYSQTSITAQEILPSP